jgi:hypothetical protein
MFQWQGVADQTVLKFLDATSSEDYDIMYLHKKSLYIE